MRTQIVDAQLHLWGADTPERPWSREAAKHAHRPYPVGKEALLFQMDLAGVSQAILVPPSWEGNRNDLVVEAARAHPDRFAVMGRLSLQDEERERRVAEWREQPGMLGIRLTFLHPRVAEMLRSGALEWLWPLAERVGVPLMLLVPGFLDEVDRIAGRHPGLKIVIDHAGLRGASAERSVWHDLPKTCALARHPNVAVKLSGFAGLSRERFPFRDVHQHVRTAFDAFGPKRTFWGSDLTRMTCTYFECIRLFTEELGWLTSEDAEWVMGRGVCEWLGWAPPPPSPP